MTKTSEVHIKLDNQYIVNKGEAIDKEVGNKIQVIMHIYIAFF